MNLDHVGGPAPQRPHTNSLCSRAATRSNGRVAAVVEDDGVGFEPSLATKNGRLGLVGMQERVQMVGGMFCVETALGAGTTVFAEVPCSRTSVAESLS